MNDKDKHKFKVITLVIIAILLVIVIGFLAFKFGKMGPEYHKIESEYHEKWECVNHTVTGYNISYGVRCDLMDCSNNTIGWSYDFVEGYTRTLEKFWFSCGGRKIALPLEASVSFRKTNKTKTRTLTGIAINGTTAERAINFRILQRNMDTIENCTLSKNEKPVKKCTKWRKVRTLD